MNEDNVIDLAAHRPGSAPENAIRPPERDLHRSNEAETLLRKLRITKRLKKADRPTLVSNLGRVIVQIDAANAKAIIKDILEEKWEKRTRYVRLPNEPVDPAARYAASGGHFARIIDRLIDVRVRQNIDGAQAKSEIVRGALKRTSFLPSSPFHMPEGKDDAEVAAFAADMSKVFDKLADEADLADFIALVSKHPIYPNDAWYQWTNSLELKPNIEPNHVYKWGWDGDGDDDEFQLWIPWWAPRCLIGHWYVPFRCQRLRLPEHGVAKIRKEVSGRCTSEMNLFYPLIEPFLSPEWMSSSVVYHRLPLWFIALPLPNKLIPCLYAAIHHPGGFYPNQQYPSDDDPINPCFVDEIGERIGDDAVYLRDDDDDYESFYVHASETEISAIGSRVDESIGVFKCDLLFADMLIDLPEWLREHPIQRFLQLTVDSDTAMSFALSPRRFSGRKWHRGDETVFRPAFPDAVDQYTPGLNQDSIAAYLLRNLVNAEGRTIFDALKDDALAKHAAARAIFNSKVAQFRQAFEERYDK